MIKELIKLANHLDHKGLTKEADFVDSVIKKAFLDESIEYAMETLKGLEKSINSGWLTLTCVGGDRDEMPPTYFQNPMDLGIAAEKVECICKRKVLENDGTEDDYKKCVKDWRDKAIKSLPPSDA